MTNIESLCSTNHRHRICILGGTGFVGQRIVYHLIKQGHEVTVVSRHADRHPQLRLLHRIQLVTGDVYDLGFLRTQFQSCDVVINLVGVLNPSGNIQRAFNRAHVELTAIICEAIRQTSVHRLLHMSALHADQGAASEYLRSKGEAEIIAHQQGYNHGFDVTSFRPSVIFGANDSFLNRFADLLKTIPFVLPLACADARFQPIFVNDVAHCFCHAIDLVDSQGKRYNLCGPKSYSLYELVNYVGEQIRVKRRIIKLSNWQSKLQALLLQYVPGKPFTPDNFRSMLVDSVCDQGLATELNLSPTTLEQVAPTYLQAAPN